MIEEKEQILKIKEVNRKLTIREEEIKKLGVCTNEINDLLKYRIESVN